MFDEEVSCESVCFQVRIHVSRDMTANMYDWKSKF